MITFKDVVSFLDTPEIEQPEQQCLFNWLEDRKRNQIMAESIRRERWVELMREHSRYFQSNQEIWNDALNEFQELFDIERYYCV